MSSPGVYFEPEPRRERVDGLTRVPAFLALDGAARVLKEPRVFQSLRDFDSALKNDLNPWEHARRLRLALRGFFENGGQRCLVVPIKEDGERSTTECLRDAFEELSARAETDLVCAPNLVPGPPLETDDSRWDRTLSLMRDIAELGREYRHFVILDFPWSPLSARGQTHGALAEQVREVHARILGRLWDEGARENAALYFPWIKVGDKGNSDLVPPSGHVAGLYARIERTSGVHRAPANTPVEDVLDLSIGVNESLHANLPRELNCLRAFPGQGVLVWGARTLSGGERFRQVSVRRLVLAVSRSIERTMADVMFEPNDPTLWLRVERKLHALLQELFVAGALRGKSAEEAFYVQCDASTNSRGVREAGPLVAELGLAPARPNEFVVVRLSCGADGVSVSESVAQDGL